METVVLSVHIVLAVSLVILVLLQQGKGADVGAVMGGGANSLFGVSGASNLLVKMTTSVAVAFMVTSVLLVRFAAGRSGGGVQAGAVDPLAGSGLESVTGQQAAPAQSDAPRADVPSQGVAKPSDATDSSSVASGAVGAVTVATAAPAAAQNVAPAPVVPARPEEKKPQGGAPEQKKGK
jgi:preprotein translocase subunit SecG